MAVKGSATITLTSYRDTQSVTRYYKLQPAGSSTPLKPDTKPPSSDWTDSEPACDISKELYFCDLTIFSNGEGEYSKVSKSTSYEAAKEAYNRAQNAQTTAEESAKTATDFISPTTNNTEDDGLKICPRAEISNPKNYLSINTDSFRIYKNGNEIAKYSQGISIKDDDGNKVFSAEIMNGKSVAEHLDGRICKKISAGVTTTFSFDLTVAPVGHIGGTIPVSDPSNGGLLGIFHVYSFMERPEELSIPSEYGTGTVLVNSTSYSNKTVTVSITNNTNIEIKVGSSAENADHMIWDYYMRDYGVATRCGGFWENDYTKAFAIGVGYNDYDRKNAFDVDWEGKVRINGVPLFDLIYPVGAIYMSMNNTSPEILFGGTWERIGVGRTLISAGGDYYAVVDANTYTGRGTNSAQKTSFPVGETGGELSHTLTIAQMPAHTHSRNYYSSNWCAKGSMSGYHGNTSGTAKTTGSTGGGDAHNNMQTYLAVYMWKRTA